MNLKESFSLAVFLGALLSMCRLCLIDGWQFSFLEVITIANYHAELRLRGLRSTMYIV